MTTSPHIDTHLDLAGLKAVHDQIAKKLPQAQLEMAVRELTVTVPAADVAAALTLLRDDSKLLFTQLIDVCGVDYMGAKHAKPARFAVVYHLLSVAHNQRVRVKVYVNDNEMVPTACGVYPAANWYERETYDMYGIVFDGHPDLRRLLTDYGFDGHPLRKDFPLEGFTEVYYDAKEKRVAYKPVDLPQEFRKFNDVSEWRGMTGNLGLADGDNTFNRKDFE